MDGLINIIKPSGMTSFDLAAYIGRRLNVKKIGHTGTLDPGACGLMTLCTGKATRISELIMNRDKTYIAEIIFGITTDTYDSYGTVTGISKYVYDRDKLEKILCSFTGEIMQLPPMYSAVKINGKKLYELARKGIPVERKSRSITISDINILDDSDPNAILISTDCSKGTYIRSLIYDIGTRYGAGAHMGFLLRTRSGDFDISSAYTIQEVIHAYENNKMDDIIISMDDALGGYDRLVIDLFDEKKFINGLFIEYTSCDVNNMSDPVRVIAHNGRFLGLGEFIRKGEKVFLKTKKLLTEDNDTGR